MSDTPVVGRITFDPQPDIVGLARIKIDGRFYGMPAWVVEHLAAMTKERDEWKAKAEANERDAGRYRYLRDKEDGDMFMENVGEDLDRVIDAARSSEKEKE